MLISEKLKKAIESEAKKQASVLKILESQEAEYKVNLSKAKEDVKASIVYYNTILEEAA